MFIQFTQWLENKDNQFDLVLKLEPDGRYLVLFSNNKGKHAIGTLLDLHKIAKLKLAGVKIGYV